MTETNPHTTSTTPAPRHRFSDQILAWVHEWALFERLDDVSAALLKRVHVLPPRVEKRLRIRDIRHTLVLFSGQDPNSVEDSFQALESAIPNLVILMRQCRISVNKEQADALRTKIGILLAAHCKDKPIRNYATKLCGILFPDEDDMEAALSFLSRVYTAAPIPIQALLEEILKVVDRIEASLGPTSLKIIEEAIENGRFDVDSESLGSLLMSPRCNFRKDPVIGVTLRRTLDSSFSHITSETLPAQFQSQSQSQQSTTAQRANQGSNDTQEIRVSTQLPCTSTPQSSVDGDNLSEIFQDLEKDDVRIEKRISTTDQIDDEIEIIDVANNGTPAATSEMIEKHEETQDQRANEDEDDSDEDEDGSDDSDSDSDGDNDRDNVDSDDSDSNEDEDDEPVSASAGRKRARRSQQVPQNTTRKQSKAKRRKSGTPRKGRVLWTDKEIEAIKDGVQRFGYGSWKKILHYHKSTLGTRTNVSIKDKWRQLQKNAIVLG